MHYAGPIYQALVWHFHLDTLCTRVLRELFVCNYTHKFILLSVGSLHKCKILSDTTEIKPQNPVSPQKV
jgi:hypothetical protein